MRRAQWILIGGLAFAGLAMTHATSGWAADGLGVGNSADKLPWARWQGRLSLGTTAPVWRAGLSADDGSTLKLNSFSLMGDYYFSRASLGANNAGGFRATSGIIVGPRSSSLWAAAPSLASGGLVSVDRRLFGQSARPIGMDANIDTATLPYLGVGYSGLSGHGGWAFSADLGLVGQSAGNAFKAGRALNNVPTLEDQLRDMRLSPVLQLGVSYSF
ncbi:hypothetical protein BH11PSE9_BH11PSE9_13420 [soil metagenome]